MATSDKTSGATGVIYASTSGVTASAGDVIAEYASRLSLNGTFLGVEESQQERFAKATYFGAGSAIIVIDEVVWLASVWDLIWDITKNASGTLNDGSTAATTYDLKQDSVPQALEFLFQMTRTGDGKKLEVEALNVICPVFSLSILKQTIVTHNITFVCRADANGIILRTAEEN